MNVFIIQYIPKCLHYMKVEDEFGNDIRRKIEIIKD